MPSAVAPETHEPLAPLAQLRLDDAPTSRAGGMPPRPRRNLRPGEVWWVPGERFYHLEAEPLRFDHIARYAVFGTAREAIEAGADGPCRRCARL